MEPVPIVQKPWYRRGFGRISVRGLAVLVLIVACWLGLIDYQARLQRDAVEAIRQVPGQVQYDWQFTGTRPRKVSPWPSWIVKNVGVDHFHDVTYVNLSGPGVTDEVLAKVGRLRNLDSLDIDASNLTDAGLASLSGLENLTTLRMINARKVTGPGLGAIAGLSGLKYLSIKRTGWVDSDLAHLSKLTELLSLNLEFDSTSHVTDDGIAHLLPLRKLQGLTFNGSEVTTKGLESLQLMENLGTLSLVNARITSLEPLEPLHNVATLNLDGNPISDKGLEIGTGFFRLQNLSLKGNPALTDAGLVPLSKLGRLRRLDLRGTNVGNSGVAYLANCPLLDALDLSDTQVGDEGLTALARGRAHCSVKVRNTRVTTVGMDASHFEGSRINIDPFP